MAQISHGGAPARPFLPARGRRALSFVTAGVLAAAGVVALAGSAQAVGALGDAAAAKGRYFGTAVAANHLGEAAYASTLDAQFDSVTPENEMKWDAVESSATRSASRRPTRSSATRRPRG